MKRNYFYLTILLAVTGVFTGNLVAQEPALARAFYEFKHVNDTLEPEMVHVEEMVLYLGKETSLYRSYHRDRLMEHLKEQVEAPGFDGNLMVPGASNMTREAYYRDANAREMTEVASLGGEDYIMEIDFPVIDWEIGTRTKVIEGYDAQEAYGTWKGRDYTVYFTTDLPFQAGPWKLSGLPGLILEATDDRDEVSLVLVAFETLEEEEIMFVEPEDAIPTTKTAFDRLREAYAKNPLAAGSARGQAGNVRGGSRSSMPDIDMGNIKSITIKNESTGRSSQTNNPLELERIRTRESRKVEASEPLVQDDHSILLKVTYDFIHIDDTTQRDNPLRDEMLLYLAKNSSLYRRVQEENNFFWAENVKGNTPETADLNEMIDTHPAVIHLFDEMQLHATNKIINSYFHYIEPVARIDWQITDEFEEIEGVSVQLATGHFGGRNYTAWFAPDIPFSAGPWKLQGLPGLILKAEDATGEVSFTMTSLEEIPSGRELTIRKPQDLHQVSRAEYEKTFAAFLANPEFFIKSAGLEGRVGIGKPTAGSGIVAKVLNNPLESNQ